MSRIGFDEVTGRRAHGERRAGFFLGKLVALAIAAVTAGCNTSGSRGSLGRRFALGPDDLPSNRSRLPDLPMPSDQIGSGPVRVGLIVPLTQGSGPSVVGQSLRNAAALALSEAGSQDITFARRG